MHRGNITPKQRDYLVLRRTRGLLHTSRRRIFQELSLSPGKYPQCFAIVSLARGILIVWPKWQTSYIPYLLSKKNSDATFPTTKILQLPSILWKGHNCITELLAKTCNPAIEKTLSWAAFTARAQRSKIIEKQYNALSTGAQNLETAGSVSISERKTSTQCTHPNFGILSNPNISRLEVQSSKHLTNIIQLHKSMIFQPAILQYYFFPLILEHQSPLHVVRAGEWSHIPQLNAGLVGAKIPHSSLPVRWRWVGMHHPKASPRRKRPRCTYT